MNGARAWPRRWPLVLIVLTALGLVYGLMELFRLRFARGDLYPPYSSLRTDPLGARVLAEGLAASGLSVTRNLGRLDRGELPFGTWYVVGTGRLTFSEATEKDWRALLAVTERGGRLVIGFSSALDLNAEFLAEMRRRQSTPGGGDDRKSDDADPEQKPTPSDPGKREPFDDPLAPPARAEPDETKAVALTEHLGVTFARLTMKPRQELRAVRAATVTTRLPSELPWHSSVAFVPNDPGWEEIYAVDGKPVVVARSWGRGSIVLAGDSFLLSNEAMLQARETGWLVWLQGSHRRAVFDERHLGVAETQGVVTLARRYGLAPTAFVLTFIGLLFIWKNNSSLIPAGVAASRGAKNDDDDGHESTGRESAAGFVNLLRRTLDVRSVFAASLAEFRHSVAWRRLAPDARRALDELGTNPSAGRDPVAATRDAHALLARKP